MNKVIIFLSLFTAPMLSGCSGSEAGPGPDVSTVADEPQKREAALSKENRKLFYETLNIRTINYRKQLESLQADGQDEPIGTAIELLSDPAFDTGAYEKLFATLFESIKNNNEADALSPYRQALTIMCHSYLDKLVGNNTNGLNEQKINSLAKFVQEINNAGIEPSAIIETWDGGKLEEISDLSAVESIEKVFN